MSDLAVISPTAGTPSETPVPDSASNSQNRIPAPLHLHVSADSTPTATFPPALTPATTTRKSLTLSTIWKNGNPPTITPHSAPLVAAASIPAIITHAPSPETRGPPPSELTTSTSSIPSATTTLTNTLPPTQSAALRALNAPAFQAHSSSSSNTRHSKSSAKSTSSNTTLSSQPVVVRTYSGPRRHRSQASNSSARFLPSTIMNGHTSSQTPSNLSAALASHPGSRTPKLPAVDDFSFSAILRAVDPEIRDAIDAIAEICARSRLSLADEYDAHLPPQGTITGTGTGTGQGWTVGRAALVSGRGRGIGVLRGAQGWSSTGAGVAGENTLTAVPEASSSSERLSVAGEQPKKDRSRSAYGSLKSVISGARGGSENRRKTIGADTFTKTSTTRSKVEERPQSQANLPSLALISTPQPSHHLSLDLSSTITDVSALDPRPATSATNSSSNNIRTHRRSLSSTSSMPASRTRSSTLSSLTSWVPWSRTQADPSAETVTTRAEARLREMLSLAGQQQQASSKGKGGVGVVSPS